MERIDFTNSAFPSYLLILTGYKWDQCFWLRNNGTLPRLLFSLKRQQESFFTSSCLLFTIYSLCPTDAPLQCIPSYIIQTPSSNISIFWCVMKPKLNAFSILKTSSIQKHGSSSLFITFLIFLNIFDFLCILVSFTNEINKNSYLKISKTNIPTELDLNINEFLAIFLRWHFNKNKLFLHAESIVHTEKLVYFSLFPDFQNPF